MQVACDLLSAALQNHSRILVWGDFDVDGQTATTILVEGLRELGGDVIYHVPVRGKETHGISRSILQSYLDQGFNLLLTCDTGITEHANIQLVRDAGLPVIVTDHHLLGETLPPANAVINPQRLPDGHPLSALPGVGAAYKVMEALYHALNHSFDAGKFLELVALGIVADVADLHGDTRYMLQKGLIHLRGTQRIGLQTLYAQANLNPLHITEDHIGFQIAPRLNAVGRLGDANHMIEFLTTQDQGRARVLATQIEALNARRRFLTRQVEKAAEAQLQKDSEERHAPIIILHHPDWPGGVVGIVASRMVERYQKPVILLTGDDPIHGSARSVEGLHITEAIATQADLLTSYGGHPMAAGLSFKPENFSALKRGMRAAIKDLAPEEELIPQLEIDQVLSLNEISLDLIEQIERLAPFGPGFPPLLFMLEKLSIVSSASVGAQGEHRQVTVEDEHAVQHRFIWWNGGDEPTPEAQFDLVCQLSRTDYKGSPEVSAQWVDTRLSEKGTLEVAKQSFNVVDQRQEISPLVSLRKLLDQAPESLLWGEGELPGGLPFLARHQLHETETLVIWNAPPSGAVLRDAIRNASPAAVVVYSQDPNLDTVQKFQHKLGGMAKYAVGHHQGIATLDYLASALSAETDTVRVGLQLWQALGNLQVEFDENAALITFARSAPDRSAVETYKTILKSLLEESKAYRRFFSEGRMQTVFAMTV